MRDVAWAIVVLAGAVIFAAGVRVHGQIRGDACLVGAIVGFAGFLPLLFFKRSED